MSPHSKRRMAWVSQACIFSCACKTETDGNSNLWQTKTTQQFKNSHMKGEGEGGRMEGRKEEGGKREREAIAVMRIQ